MLITALNCQLQKTQLTETLLCLMQIESTDNVWHFSQLAKPSSTVISDFHFGHHIFPLRVSRSTLTILHFTVSLLPHWRLSKSISSMFVSSIAVISVFFNKRGDKYWLDERFVKIYELLFFIWLQFISNKVMEDVPDLSWTNAACILIHLSQTLVLVIRLTSVTNALILTFSNSWYSLIIVLIFEILISDNFLKFKLFLWTKSYN